MSERDKLDLILERMTTLENGQKALENGQKELVDRVANVETGQRNLEKAQRDLENGQKDLTARVSNLESGQKNIEEGQKALKAGQREIKEITNAIRIRQETADAKRERIHNEMTSGFALTEREFRRMNTDLEWMTVKMTEHDEEIEHLKS